ncbi:MAG TPA: multiheme c-type cytochrome [Candidatus Tripitaka californicus]|uniref:multiheme c-type cytochrome n=1 Tax=Candidatus Tripitaka californicus TaxID=3367616 RepID=UPI0040283CBB|nr:hydroxylamine reductase [Planctomycetota bacterium]
MSLKGLASILAVSLSCLSLCCLAVLPPAVGEVAGPPSTEAEKGHVDAPHSAYGHGGIAAGKEVAPTHPGEAGKGVGPYGKYWDPIPTHKYWAPQHFYKPPSIPQGVFSEKDCEECHSKLNPLLVKSWSESAHGSSKKLNSHQKRELKEIQTRLGRKVPQVGCIDCHGRPGAEKLNHGTELVMPMPETCGVCHPKEVEEFSSEAKYGIPDWPEGRESHARSYDANLGTDVWAATDKNIVQGCDMCHNIQHKCDSCHTRHAFKAAEARRPEACATCHNGPDHPDIEDYLHSKHGTIYTTEGSKWDWEEPLKEAQYPAPTCASCHMYYRGKFSHNMVRKAIMGEGDVLFYNNIFKNVLPSKYISENPELMDRRIAWIETCSQCHSTRFSREYLTSMDMASDQVFAYVKESYELIKALYEEKALFPMPADRPKAPPPVEEKWPDTLGGFYGEFWAKEGNPSRIERDFLYMWENDAFLVRKGLAHVNPNAFTYISWSNLLKKYIGMQSEAAILRRLKALEETGSEEQTTGSKQ